MNQLPTSRPVMNSPADEAEARDRANTAPQQADPDALCRGETGVSSGSEARPVTATEQPFEWPPAFSIACKCEPFTCRPQSNIDRYCWRSGCPIFARDFADTSKSNSTETP